MGIFNGLKGRLILLGAIPVVLFLLLSIFYIVPSFKEDIYNEKELQTKEFVSIGLSTLEMYYKLEQSGELSRDEAQKQAMEVIKNIRYGETNADYFWINDMQPNMIMHPLRPDLDGQDLNEFQDPDGLHIFVEFAKVAERDGRGFVPYQWQYYSEKDRIEPKLSHVAHFEPWNWVIGTGIYINDVEEIIFKKMVTMFSYILGIIIITSIIIFVFAHKLIINPLKYAVSVGEKMADGDFTEKISDSYLRKKDEISRLLNVFSNINKNMEKVIGDVLKNSDKINDHSNELKTNIEKTNISINNTVGASQSLLEVAASQKTGANESYQAIEELAHGSTGIADYAITINEYSDELVQKVDKGNKIVKEAISKMSEIKVVTESTSAVIKQLNDDSKEIGSILGLISGVAEQTNLLALNAAIEAARVGEQGKGFAVVADEIRKLANDTANSVGRVGSIIEGIANKTGEAVTRTMENVKSVDEGIDNVKKVEDMIKDILHAQEEISNKITDMSSITQEMSANTEELTATVSEFTNTSDMTAESAKSILNVSKQQQDDMNQVLVFSKELEEMAMSLKQLVSKFKLK